MCVKKRDIRIDFLKGVAMLLVVLLHSIQFLNGIPTVIRVPVLFGQMGVQLFFVCSGFLIAKTYLGRESTVSLKGHGRFMLKKYVSLVIPFVLFLCIYILSNLCLETLGVDVPYSNNTHPLSIALNVLLLHGLFPFCLNNVVPGGWYVGTLFLLLLICPAFRLKNRKSYFLAAVIVSAVATGTAFVLHALHMPTDNGSYFYFSFLNQLPAFLVGMGMGREERKKQHPVAVILMRLAVEFVLIGILFLFGFVFSFSLIPLLSAAFFADVYELLRKLPDENIEKWGKPILHIGANTYPIYLAHFLTVWYIPNVLKAYLPMHWPLQWAIGLLGSAVLCMVAPYITAVTDMLKKKLLKKAAV